MGRLAIETSDDGQRCDRLAYIPAARERRRPRVRSERDHPRASRRIRLGEHVFGEFRRGDGDAQVHVPRARHRHGARRAGQARRIMEGAVEELLGISRAKRGMGGGSGGGRIGAHGDDDDGYGGGGGRDDRYGGNDGGFGGGSDGPPRSNQMDGYGRGQGGRCVSTRARATTTLGTPRRREIRGCLARHRVARDPRPRSPDPSRTTTFFPRRAPAALPGVVRARVSAGTRVPVCKMCQLTFPTPRRRSAATTTAASLPRGGGQHLELAHRRGRRTLALLWRTLF